MPTYEYRCGRCEALSQRFVLSISKGEEDVPCEREGCGGVAHRIISRTLRPIFKGPGFYETDYKKPQKKLVTKSVSGKQEHKEEALEALGGAEEHAKKTFGEEACDNLVEIE